MVDAKDEARRAVESHRDLVTGVSRAIHDRPELGFEEFHAASVVGEALADAGFEVETAAFGMATALAARAGSGPLSVVVCAEYDALAGIGHACGHNLIAAAAVGAGLALASVADAIGISITVLGTPAEEGGGGKVLMLERGAFEGAHVAMMVHPWHEDRLEARCLAVDHLEVRFTGRDAHASAAPEKGVNAADAVVVSQVAIGLLRQHLPAGDQVHGIVTKGGDAPNIVPREAVARFMVRSPSLARLAELRPRIERCFQAGALATGASLDVTELSPTYSEYVGDVDLTAAWRRNAEALGRRYEADDAGRPLPTISTDMANVSLAVPSIHPLIGLSSGGAVIHEPGFADAAVGPSAEAAALDGAIAMAWTAVDAATDPQLRERLLTGADAR